MALPGHVNISGSFKGQYHNQNLIKDKPKKHRTSPALAAPKAVKSAADKVVDTPSPRSINE